MMLEIPPLSAVSFLTFDFAKTLGIITLVMVLWTASLQIFKFLKPKTRLKIHRYSAYAAIAAGLFHGIVVFILYNL